MSGSAGVIEIAQSGTEGLRFKDTDMGMTCDSKLDGKDYPCTGPMMPQGFTIAMKNAPPCSLDITVKKDGKEFFKATYTVAADGKSMTETGGAVANTEKFKITELIPPKSLGPPNSLSDLRHYVTGRAPGGLVVTEDGSLNWDRSFQTVDYLSALRSISVRNNVQPGLAPKPIDFIAVGIPDRDAVLLWRDDAHQALILTRGNEIRYQPVNESLEPAAWGPGLPLELFEDPQLKIPSGDRATWLNQWHGERAWLEDT